MLCSPEALGEQSATLYIINCDNTLQNNIVADSLLASTNIIPCVLPEHAPPPFPNSETHRQFRPVKIPHCSVRNTRSIPMCQNAALLRRVALGNGEWSSDSTLYLDCRNSTPTKTATTRGSSFQSWKEDISAKRKVNLSRK